MKGNIGKNSILLNVSYNSTMGRGQSTTNAGFPSQPVPSNLKVLRVEQSEMTAIYEGPSHMEFGKQAEELSVISDKIKVEVREEKPSKRSLLSKRVATHVTVSGQSERVAAYLQALHAVYQELKAAHYDIQFVSQTDKQTI